MLPNMNPRAMKQAMKRLGIQQQEIAALEVVIRTEDSEIVIANPEVSKVNMMGQETFQIVGDYEERALSTTPDINDDDIKTVMEQANVSEDRARQALEECSGDLAEAILSLESDEA